MAETIAQAFVEFGATGVDKVKSALSSIKGGLSSMGVGLGTLGVVAGVGATIAMAVKKAMDAEEGQHKLRSALAATGQEVDNNMAKIKQYAASLSQVTTMTKGEVNGLVQRGLQLGLNAEQAQKFATTAAGLAKRTGMGTQDALENLVKLAHGMRNTFDRSVPAIAAAGTQQDKLAAASKLAGEGMEMLYSDTETSKGGFEKLTQGISSLYTQFGTLFLPIVQTVIAKLQDFVNWIQHIVDTIKDVGPQSTDSFDEVSSGLDMVGSIFNAVTSAIGSAVIWIIKQFYKIPIAIKLVGAGLAAGFDYMIEYITVWAKNAWATVEWFYQNFGDIAKTTVNFIWSFFENLGKNIVALWNGVKDLLSGKGWHPDFHNFTEGFQNEVKKMPEYVSAKNLGYGAVFDEILDEADKMDSSIGEKWQKSWEKTTKKSSDTIKKELNESVEEGIEPIENLKEKKGKEKKDKGASFTGLTDIWKNAMQAVNKAPEETAKNTARTADATERMAEAMESQYDSGGLSIE